MKWRLFMLKELRRRSTELTILLMFFGFWLGKRFGPTTMWAYFLVVLIVTSGLLALLIPA